MATSADEVVREVGQESKAHVVLGKPLRVLPAAELFEPVGYLRIAAPRTAHFRASGPAGRIADRLR